MFYFTQLRQYVIRVYKIPVVYHGVSRVLRSSSFLQKSPALSRSQLVSSSCSSPTELWSTRSPKIETSKAFSVVSTVRVSLAFLFSRSKTYSMVEIREQYSMSIRKWIQVVNPTVLITSKKNSHFCTHAVLYSDWLTACSSCQFDARASSGATKLV